MDATLYNKNTPLVDVDIDNGVIREIGEVKNTDLLPLFLQKELTVDTANQWLSKRKIPENREGLADVRMAFRGFEKYRTMFSLSDQYWFRYNKNQTWAKGNFFTNRYKSEVGNMFLAPWLVDRKRVDVENPDLTTNGVLKKKWVQDEEGASWLYKAGSAAFHQSPITEVMAAITLKKLGIVDFVDYDLVIEGTQFCCKCKNFLTEDEEFVPAKHLYMQKDRLNTQTVYSHMIYMCKQYGIENAQKQVDAMLMADVVLCNTDRHLGNFGFIRDVNTGKIKRFAPLFDNGSAYRPQDKTDRTTHSFFDTEKKRVTRMVAQRIDHSLLVDTAEIYELLDTYPHISDKRRAEIKRTVEKMHETVEKSDKKRQVVEFEH